MATRTSHEYRLYLVARYQCRNCHSTLYKRTDDQLFHLIASFAGRITFQHDHPSMKLDDECMQATLEGGNAAATILLSEFFDASYKGTYHIAFKFENTSAYYALAFATPEFEEYVNSGYNTGRNHSVVLWCNNTHNASSEFKLKDASHSAMQLVWGDRYMSSQRNAEGMTVICEINMQRRIAQIWNAEKYFESKGNQCVEVTLPEKATVAVAFANFGADKATVSIVQQYFVD